MEEGTREVSYGTATTYSKMQRKFGKWLLQNGYEEYTLYGRSPDVQALIHFDPPLQPLYDYLEAMQEKTDEEGNPKPESYGSLCILRSAINYELAYYGEKLPHDVAEKLAAVYKERRDYDKILREQGAFSRNKTHSRQVLPFRVYQDLCKAALRSRTTERLLLHRFMVLSWSIHRDPALIARLTVDDLTFDSDSVLVRIPKRKTHNATEEQFEYCRVYAIPACVWICPVLAIAIALFTQEKGEKSLFPGENQHQRFLPLLKDLLEPDKDFWYAVEDISAGWLGAASFWKGAKKRAGFDNSSFFSGYDHPSFLHFHKVPNLEECQRLGMGLALRSIDSAPPHFSPRKDDTKAREFLKDFFGEVPTAQEDALLLLLASVVDRHSLLRSVLPQQQVGALEKNISPEIAEELLTAVTDEWSGLVPTGVPDWYQPFLQAIDIGMSDVVAFFKGCEIEKLPKDLCLPHVSLEEGWKLWWLGSAELSLPPVRGILPLQMTTRGLHTYEDWKVVFETVERFLSLRGWKKESPNEEEVEEMYARASPLFQERTAGMKRSHSSLRVRGVANKFKKITDDQLTAIRTDPEVRVAEEEE